MTYANDRESTIEEYAEALDIETKQRVARVLLDKLNEEWLNWMDKRHVSDWTDEETIKYSRLTGQDITCAHGNVWWQCDQCANGVPAPSADEQATNEEGGKDVSARPTRTACDWMREEGVLRELPN